MQCACTSGIIQCSRKVSLVKFLELTPPEDPPIGAVTFTESCNQPECNVAKYMEKNAGVCHGKFPVAFVADRIFYHGTFSLTSTDIDVRLPCILTFTGMLSTFDFLRRFRRSTAEICIFNNNKNSIFFARFARFISLHTSYKHFPFLSISQPFSSYREEALASKTATATISLQIKDLVDRGQISVLHVRHTFKNHSVCAVPRILLHLGLWRQVEKTN